MFVLDRSFAFSWMIDLREARPEAEQPVRGDCIDPRDPREAS